MTESEPDSFARSLRHFLLDHRWLAARLGLFVILTFGLAFGSPRSFGTRVIGDPGDAFLIMSLLIWGGDRSLDLFQGYWGGPMFAGGDTVMAYTDTFLPLTVPFKLIEAATGSPVIAFNTLFVLSFVLTAEFTYRLGTKLTASRSAATIGAVAFTFSTIRLSQVNHFQLCWAALIPLTFLWMLRFRANPSALNGAVLAALVIAQFLTSAYYGVVIIVAVAAFGMVRSWRALRAGRWRSEVTGLATLAAVTAVGLTPFVLWYRQGSESSTTREGYPGSFAFRPSDLFSPAPTATVPRSFSYFDTDTAARSSESYAYLGGLVLLMVPVFAVLLLRRREELELSVERRWALGLLSGVGLFALLFALGRGEIGGIGSPFYDIITSLVPGTDSITALVRQIIFLQLALVAMAVVAAGWVLSMIPDRPVRVGLAAVVVALVAFESHAQIPTATVPVVRADSVYGQLQRLEAGVLLELPISPRDAPGYPFLESTRMLLGSEDRLQTVNGYSGYAPIDYDETVSVMNTFPSDAAIDALRSRGIDCVVVHTAPLDTGLPAVSDLVNSVGYAFYPPEAARDLVDRLPAGLVDRVIEATDGIILVLS